MQDLLKADAFVSILDKSILKKLPPSPRLLEVQVDVTDIEALTEAVERTVTWTKKTGAPLGGVINCAGIGIPSLVSMTDPHLLSYTQHADDDLDHRKARHRIVR